MVDEKLWQQGMTIGDFVKGMDKYQEEMRIRLRDTRITPAECQRLRTFGKPRKVVVLTEAWCPDSLMNLPLLIKMADCMPELEIRIFIRSQLPELSKELSLQGYEKIPLFIIMDEHLQLIGYWMERPLLANKRIAEWIKHNPKFVEAKAQFKMNPGMDRSVLDSLIEKFVDEMWNWYDTELQSETVKEVLAAMA
ncbi:MAG: hypothetical protein BGO78_04245 [Chloroflexi bacterium 44-23]|nr:MAG: hypothetical protein BGO78_04245 [Chloroflexi bacterium 44-23]